MKQILQNIQQRAYEGAVECYQNPNNPVPVNVPAPRIKLVARKYIVENAYKDGFTYGLASGLILLPKVLKDEIINGIKTANDTINKYIENTVMLFEEGKSLKGFSPGYLRYLSKIGVPNENFGILAKEHYQIYTTGCSPMKIIGMDFPLWQYELFFTRLEFDKLVDDLDKLQETQDRVRRRVEFCDTWKMILKSHVGDINDSIVEKMTIEQIEIMRYGIPNTSEVIRKLTLKQCADPQQLSDIDLERWIAKIDRSYKKLSPISYLAGSSGDQYSFTTVNKERFFWVPQSLIP
jgi:hypothetical protein